MLPCVRIDNIIGKGRGVIAIDRISKGQLICTKEALCIVIAEEWIDQCCETCLKAVSCDVVCEDCESSFFCSNICLDQARITFHKNECLCLRRAIPTRVPESVRQALLAILSSYESGERSFFELHGDLSVYSGIALHQFKMYGNLLRKMLGDDIFPDLSPSDLSDCVIKVLKNSLSVPSSNNNIKGVASGIFLDFAMLNHECIPSCEASFLGRTVQVRALRDVSSGTELTTRYTNGGGWNSRYCHLEKFGFECCCLYCKSLDVEGGFSRNFEIVVNGCIYDPNKRIENNLKSLECPSLFSICTDFHSKFKNDSLSIHDCVAYASNIEPFIIQSSSSCGDVLSSIGSEQRIFPFVLGPKDRQIQLDIVFGPNKALVDNYILNFLQTINQKIHKALKMSSKLSEVSTFHTFLTLILDNKDGLLLSLTPSHSASSILFFAASNALAEAASGPDHAILAEAVLSLKSFTYGEDIFAMREAELRNKIILMNAAVQCMMYRVAADMTIYPGGVSRLVSLENLTRLLSSAIQMLEAHDHAVCERIKTKYKAMKEDSIMVLLQKYSDLNMKDHQVFKWAQSEKLKGEELNI